MACHGVFILDKHWCSGGAADIAGVHAGDGGTRRQADLPRDRHHGVCPGDASVRAGSSRDREFSGEALQHDAGRAAQAQPVPHLCGRLGGPPHGGRAGRPGGPVAAGGLGGESKDKPGSTGAADSQDAGAHRVAGLASQAGGFLSSSARGEAAASMARGMATGAVGGEVQQWLSQFGTARVQLDADKNFSLKQSQLDLLVPLHEKKDRLVFAQGSVHRTDERTQTNLGVGYRWFNDGWMLGGNTFLDHDLSRSHTRMGVGLEYWRDFLKLGANSYHRLSSWKDSPDLTDYEERPANGWDLRAQAWVPALPQLGGKLTFEQYYGDQVGLFGKDARQSNPHAITAGVNYTPIPLLTFNAEHRQGQAGKSDARLGWRCVTSWACRGNTRLTRPRWRRCAVWPAVVMTWSSVTTTSCWNTARKRLSDCVRRSW
ncbi:hypothetical protein CEQ31_000845 [Serratia odorifera]|nr:hypothetical protein CEQ31_000845 [Serratia odorifera]